MRGNIKRGRRWRGGCQDRISPLNKVPLCFASTGKQLWHLGIPSRTQGPWNVPCQQIHNAWWCVCTKHDKTEDRGTHSTAAPGGGYTDPDSQWGLWSLSNGWASLLKKIWGGAQNPKLLNAWPYRGRSGRTVSGNTDVIINMSNEEYLFS